jgi:hypothetical protein
LVACCEVVIFCMIGSSMTVRVTTALPIASAD